MRLLRALAAVTAVGAWCVIVIGGYVTATNSGLGCRNVIDCGQAPITPEAAAIEVAHRLAAWTEGFLVLALLILVLWRYRAWRRVRDLTLLAFLLIAVQSALGMASVYAGFEAYSWYPILVTAHLGVATAFLAVTVLNATTIFRGTPPASAIAAERSSRDSADA